MDFLYLLEGIRTPVLDALFSAVTYLGHELVVIGVICVLLWCVDKNFAYRLGMIFFLSGLGVQALKITFRIPRPWVLDPGFSPVESAMPAATGYSFPSGHTQGATALFASLAVRFRRVWLKLLCVLAVLAVAFSRMYLGVHTPADVLTAFGLSLAALVLVIPLARVLERTTRHDLPVALALAALSGAVMVYSLVLYGNGTISDYKMAADCCKSAASGFAFACGWYIERRYIHFDTRCDRLWKQGVKLVMGLAGALILKEGIKLAFGVCLATDIIRYLLVVFWVVAVFPWLWSKLPLARSAAADAVQKTPNA